MADSIVQGRKWKQGELELNVPTLSARSTNQAVTIVMPRPLYDEFIRHADERGVSASQAGRDLLATVLLDPTAAEQALLQIQSYTKRDVSRAAAHREKLAAKARARRARKAGAT